MNQDFEGKIFKVGDRAVVFKFEIKEILTTSQGSIVQLKSYAGNECNIFFVDFEGKILWQIENAHMPSGCQIYVAMKLIDDTTLWVSNFGGVDCKVDLKTGVVDDCIGQKD